MNIYLLEQGINNGYDTYDSCIVYAKSEEEARNIHPSQFVTHTKEGKWMGTYSKGGEYEQDNGGWVEYKNIDKITVTLLGKAIKEVNKGVILASFNAG